MSRSMLAAAATVIVAAAVPAMAQGSSIIVSAPAVRAEGEPVNGVHQRRQFVSQVAVAFADLDLRTANGRYLLDRRVRVAADAACDRLDAIDPPTGVGANMSADYGDCRHLAFRRAQPQVQRVILAYG